VPRPGEPPERCRLDAKQGLRDLDQTELVGPVDEDARVKREQEHRKRLRRRDECDKEGTIREL